MGPALTDRTQSDFHYATLTLDEYHAALRELAANRFMSLWFSGCFPTAVATSIENVNERNGSSSRIASSNLC